MLNVLDTARYLIILAHEAEEPMTHMRLQKLLYYVQGWSLAFRDIPMFDEPVEAWQHGPVVPAILDIFSVFGSSEIPAYTVTAGDQLPEPDRKFVESVWQSYCRFSASGLRERTHRERPWRDAIALGRKSPISHDAMASYFKSQDVSRMPGLQPDEIKAAEASVEAGDYITHQQLLERLQN